MTDTRLKKTKTYIKNAKNNIFDKINIKPDLSVILCILSLIAVDRNSFLCVLPLVIMQSCEEKTSMYLCGILSAIYYISTIFHTSFYVPCTAFVVIYLAGDCMLSAGRVKPVWFAGSVFALSKLYVLTFGYQGIYFAVFAAELAAVLLLPQIVAEGAEILKSSKEQLSPAQLFSAACALIVLAASVGGISIYGLNFSVTMMFAAALYFMMQSNIVLSMLAFICMSLAVCQDKNFSFLFTGFLVIYLGSSTMTNKSAKGCVYTVLIAFAVSILFLTKFNSFVFLAVTAASVAAAFTADKFATPSKAAVSDDATGEKDYIRLSQQIEKLNRCFNFLGHTVIDISNLVAKDDIPNDAGDIAAQKLCRRCKNNTLCWQQHYDHTQKQFSACVRRLQKGEKAEFDSLFLSRCIKSEELEHQLEEAVRLENARRLICRSGVHNQKILQNQFLVIARVLGDITRQTARKGIVNTAYTYKISSYVASVGIAAEYSVCYQNTSKCVIAAKDEIDGGQLEAVRIKLEKIYGEKFAPAEQEKVEGSTVYTFRQVPLYCCEIGTGSTSRYSVCGDICESFSNGEYTYIMLADGMGTGSFAAAESRTAAAMLKSLLMSDVNAETAIELVNTALNLKGTGQSCVALDILRVDLFGGNCTIYKAGAAASILLDRGKTNRLYKDSLPVGILKDIKIAKAEFVLENGGTVIMMSDGVNMDERLIQKIQIMHSRLSAEETAHMITDRQDNTDDATAVVMKLIRT